MNADQKLSCLIRVHLRSFAVKFILIVRGVLCFFVDYEEVNLPPKGVLYGSRYPEHDYRPRRYSAGP